MHLSDRKKVIVLGAGPIRIGQGVEFDYSTVHAVQTIQKAGYEAIIINNNPETVSTDYTTADKLYVPKGREITFTLVENGDGTLTVVFEDICPVAFVTELGNAAPTGDAARNQLGIFIGLMVVSAAAIVVILCLKGKKH